MLFVSSYVKYESFIYAIEINLIEILSSPSNLSGNCLTMLSNERYYFISVSNGSRKQQPLISVSLQKRSKRFVIINFSINCSFKNCILLPTKIRFQFSKLIELRISILVFAADPVHHFYHILLSYYSISHIVYFAQTKPLQ